eukprot:TRINITY_DN5786_c0_g1_i1.p1 TRINITY_DN5786_c0_g1~~TRINITY_DN5786_c0_g1_i1.p1  ORF type:complete len:295 (-),score=51.00 TRINITY_DN5786_c0_g1_i1:315-1199(-)
MLARVHAGGFTQLRHFVERKKVLKERGDRICRFPRIRGMAEKKIGGRLELPSYLEDEEQVVQLSPREARTKLPVPRCVDTVAEDPFHTDLLHVTETLSEFAIDYTPEAVNHKPEDLEISVTFDSKGGSRWRSLKQYLAGSFSSKIKAPSGNSSGLCYSFYLSSREAEKSRDQICFQFLGRDKTIIQTNYFTNGVGDEEVIHELGFDTSAKFHDYSIKWYPSKIEWFVDGKLIRTASREGNKPFPEKPMFLYASVSDASAVDDGKWAGKYIGSEEPYVVYYKNVVVPLCSLEEEG